jgi:excisionase family DNA binding protein
MIYLDGTRRYDDVLTVEGLMDYLAVGKNTAYRLIKEKKIKAIKIGRIYKIPKENVQEFLRNSKM